MTKIAIDPRAKGLIFDLDGTISDSLPIHFENWFSICRQYDCVIDKQVLIDMTGRPTIDFAKYFVDHNNLDADPDFFRIRKQEEFWKNAHKVEPVSIVIDIIKQVADI